MMGGRHRIRHPELPFIDAGTKCGGPASGLLHSRGQPIGTDSHRRELLRPHGRRLRRDRHHALNVSIKYTDCVSCGARAETCPTGALMMRERDLQTYELDIVRCIYCGDWVESARTARSARPRTSSSRPTPLRADGAGEGRARRRADVEAVGGDPARRAQLAASTGDPPAGPAAMGRVSRKARLTSPAVLAPSISQWRLR
jgi:ferredoxin